MSEIICVTNKRLCQEDFFLRIEKLAKAKPKAILLREKELSEEEYFSLAKRVISICEMYKTPCILHSFSTVAIALNCKAIHMPLPLIRNMSSEEKKFFSVLGASCHSVTEAKEALRLGCTYIIAGHIFETDCKKGMEGRGISFLSEVCKSVSLPVYAIGGINAENISKVRKAGAKGGCSMSSMMTCEEPAEEIRSIINGI